MYSLDVGTLGTFLANVISGWTPATTQNTTDLLKAQDLQVAKYSSEFSMSHKMGLARIRLLKSLQNVSDATDVANRKITRTVSDIGDLYATETMETGYPIPLRYSDEDVANESKAYYYIVKASTETTFRGKTSDSNKWQDDINVTLASNSYGDYSASRVGGVYSYTGDFQFCWSGLIFKVPFDGTYMIECWGAQGGGGTGNDRGGYGGYTKGQIYLSKDEKLYIFIGNKPARNTENSFNGGGQANNTHYPTDDGGGATDVRTYVADENALTTWNNTTSLNSRIMVAAAGGGGNSYRSGSAGGAAGGIEGYNGTYTSDATTGIAYKGTQLAGGSGNAGGASGDFGYGGDGELKYGGGGGGSGYYGGGGGGNNAHVSSGAGGSSYISGHPGCIAISSSSSRSPKDGNSTTSNLTVARATHYSGKVFSETKMIDGTGYSCKSTNGTSISKTAEQMPNPAGGNYGSGVGHSGNGRCKITYIP